MPTRYVAGFLFSPDGQHVALIRKTKPEWQAGRLNGIGGKVEPYEAAYEAMCREFKEETGAVVTDWTCFAGLECTSGDAVDFFKATGNPLLKSTTEEVVDWYYIPNLHSQTIVPNLKWLIPLALCADTKYSHTYEVAK